MLIDMLLRGARKTMHPLSQGSTGIGGLPIWEKGGQGPFQKIVSET